MNEFVEYVEHNIANAPSTSELIAYIKNRDEGDYHLGWDHFIQARGLKPEINFSDFIDIYNEVDPCPLMGNSDVKTIEWKPNVWDRMHNRFCVGWRDEFGIWRFVYRSGYLIKFIPPNLPDPEHYGHICEGIQWVDGQTIYTDDHLSFDVVTQLQLF